MAMTSMQRVLATLEFQEPDRVPLFLLVSLHGARELGLTIREYFSRAENVFEGQVRLRAKYGHDCLYAFFHAPLEVEAWGGEVVFRDDGPPNSGAPFLRSFDDIPSLVAPRIQDSRSLQEVLRCIDMLAKRVDGEAPVIGVAMSPFSLPVMQLGFERYLQLLLEHRDRFWQLMRVNEQFTTAWANAQLAAGATAICYFDPVSSPTIIPPALYRETGKVIAERTLAAIKGPVATHLASGRALPISENLIDTGTAVVGASSEEDLADLKRAFYGKATVLGNLNGLTMRRWSQAETEVAVKQAVTKGGPGGGFILSDNHGEIPIQVPDDTLLAIAEATRQWGRYPMGTSSEDA